MKDVQDLLDEHFEMPKEPPTIICKHCGMPDIWSLSKHLTKQHGIDVSDYTFSRTPDPAASDDYGRKLCPA